MKLVPYDHLSMDRFAESYRKQRHAHLHQYRVCQYHRFKLLLVFSHRSSAAPYRKVHASPHPAIAFAPSSLRSHAKGNGRVRLAMGALNKEDETLVNDSTLEKQSEPDSDDPIFYWEESATLLSDLMDEK